MNQIKNKFDTICNTVDNGIIVLNKNLEVQFWNRWLEIRTSILETSIAGKSILEFYPSIDGKKLKRKILTAIRLNSPTFYTPQTNDFLVNIELKNIADKVFKQMQQSITITPLDTDGNLVILYVYDVTFLSEINYKLNIAKQELSDKNEELRLILDTTMEAIIIFKDNKVVDCNKIAVELFKKNMRYELMNRDFSDLIYEKRAEAFDDFQPFETVIKREDESSFSAIINIKDTLLNNQIYKIVTIVDIDELKRNENLMAEQTKLAAMGEMIANIAHQWRQPLNIISITASNLKLKDDLGELTNLNLKESLSLILKTTTHLSNTIDTFNNFLKTHKEKAVFNINENIKSSISLIDGFFKNFNIEIILELEDDLFLNSVANEFSQAFINILNNAKDAILLNLNDSEKGLIKVKTKKINDNIEISIIDNALGIEKEILNKIFEPYFTTKHKYQGTGLGLYMTRKIINSSMGGEISARNSKFIHDKKEYKGAEFKITIPINLD